MKSKTSPQSELHAVVRRADGSTINLGRVDARLPWRVWLYRLKVRTGRIKPITKES